MSEKPEKSKDLPVAMTVAGSDSGGGAGIQADLLTFGAMGVFGTTAITCLTAQNPDGVSAVAAMTPEFVEAQLSQISSYFEIKALKTGMLFNVEIVEVVAKFLQEHPEIEVVVDPVMVATSGAVLLQKEAIKMIRHKLLPLASLITPNLDEAAVLLGQRPETLDAMRAAGRELVEQFGVNVLLKGGHLESARVYDLLCLTDGRQDLFEHERVHNIHTHGSGCTLSAAITAELAKEQDLTDATRDGLNYVLRTMKKPLQVGETKFMAHL